EADNATVTTAGIEEITPTGIRTADGTHHDVDVIVYCTGFIATEFLATINVRGLGGKDLQEYWSSTGARAYLGLSVPNFPNMFLMYGPNTNVGAGSIIYMQEGQAQYIRRAVEHLDKQGPSYVAVREEVEEAFDTEVQQRMQKTVWLQGESWYRDKNGRVSTNWPMRLLEYRRRTKKFDPADYETTPVGRAGREPRGEQRVETTVR
ncbi:MAG TPA: 4-hydroxyacetophenone monooxygenase, partial [Nocardioidaceae bacterium]|nr:4-hydroxyacetophenone monooxygenase [Nocardioidaceae bacterium]